MELEIHNMAGHLIRRLHQISISVFQDHMRQHGYDTTSVQFSALNALQKYPKIDQATLAGLIAYDKATIGGVIDRLEVKKFVKRTVSKRDRRAREVELTKEGLAALEAMKPIVLELQNEILAGLAPDEREVFVSLAEKLAKNGNHLSRAPLTIPAKG